MTVRNQCLAEVDLVEYLYDEGDARDAAAIAAHVATCGTCAEEVRALQATREGLQAWTPPEVADGFMVATVQPAPRDVLRLARWWQRPLPAWAQVAAAVVLFSAGVGLGALRATGADPAAGVSTAQAVATTSDAGATPVSSRDLAALEERLRAEMTARTSASPRAVASRQDDEALLQQVQALISESERRQQQELTLRTAELVKDVDAQRRGDLARIERTFGQMEGTTGVQVEQQRQLLNYLMRVSQQKPQ
jgi:anti-sigma factor RsiW